DPAAPETSLERNRLFRYRWSRFTAFGGLVMLLNFVWMQITMVGLVRNSWLVAGVPLMLMGIIVAGALWLAIGTGQGGSRIRMESAKLVAKLNRDDDRYWKWGIFYYNPDDPAWFVEKRFGIGWTNNFAQPASWMLLA